MNSLKDSVALVTGASSGIGRAIALQLGSLGAKVVVAYGSSVAHAEEVVKLIGSDQAKAIKADMSSMEDIQKLVDETVSAWGKIDFLISAAGVMTIGTLENMSQSAFDKTFNVNVKGSLFLVQKASKHMGPGSRIVLFSTTLCHVSTIMPHYLMYIASKGAIEQATKALARELAGKQINVNCVAPGPTESRGFIANQTPQSLEMVTRLNPYGRIGKPDEIADTVVFLCQDSSRWVTGQTIKVNGGMA